MSNYQTIEIERFSEMFGALSNPKRLTILLRLIECCGTDGCCATDSGMTACVGELSEGLELAPSTISHHLKELRRTGLISMTRHGRRVECAINAEALEELKALVGIDDQDTGNGCSPDKNYCGHQKGN
jgi:ArsR family transcriptional regulator, arsenate/arsenite/antimonite-responsive transcriptional repressor